MSIPSPDPFTSPSELSPMGPPGASPFGTPPPQSEFQKLSPAPVSKNMELWQKFLGKGATPAQVEKFQSNFLNAITQQFKKEAEKSRERQKEDFRRAEGKD